jgi:hypothetical protein
MRLLGLGLLLAAMVVSGSVLAQGLSGNELWKKCRASDDQAYGGYASTGFCIGYIRGVADVMLLHDVWDRSLCFPKNVNLRQVRDVVIKYLETYPQMRHSPASLLIADALGDAFPCQ